MATKYRVVQDENGPYKGRWVVEDFHGRVLEGPFDSEADARHEVRKRERRGEDMKEVH